MSLLTCLAKWRASCLRGMSPYWAFAYAVAVILLTYGGSSNDLSVSTSMRESTLCLLWCAHFWTRARGKNHCAERTWFAQFPSQNQPQLGNFYRTVYWEYFCCTSGYWQSMKLYWMVVARTDGTVELFMKTVWWHKLSPIPAFTKYLVNVHMFVNSK